MTIGSGSITPRSLGRTHARSMSMNPRTRGESCPGLAVTLWLSAEPLGIEPRSSCRAPSPRHPATSTVPAARRRGARREYRRALCRLRLQGARAFASIVPPDPMPGGGNAIARSSTRLLKRPFAFNIYPTEDCADVGFTCVSTASRRFLPSWVCPPADTACSRLNRRRDGGMATVACHPCWI